MQAIPGSQWRNAMQKQHESRGVLLDSNLATCNANIAIYAGNYRKMCAENTVVQPPVQEVCSALTFLFLSVEHHADHHKNVRYLRMHLLEGMQFVSCNPGESGDAARTAIQESKPLHARASDNAQALKERLRKSHSLLIVEPRQQVLTAAGHAACHVMSYHIAGGSGPDKVMSCPQLIYHTGRLPNFCRAICLCVVRAQFWLRHFEVGSNQSKACMLGACGLRPCSACEKCCIRQHVAWTAVNVRPHLLQRLWLTSSW